MIPRIVKVEDLDYPLPMLTVPYRDNYTILKIQDTYFVPLYQVIDLIRSVPEVQKDEP